MEVLYEDNHLIIVNKNCSEIVQGEHPNYKYTSDFDKRNTFDIEKFLNRKMKLKKNDVFTVVDADAL